MSLYRFFLVLVCLGLTLACKKEITNPPDPIVPIEPTEQDRLKATIYDYYNKYSLWTEHIPDRNEDERLTFIRQHRSNNAVLNALKSLTPPHPGYNGSIDRFSFLDESDSEGNTSLATGQRMDTNDGYGLYFSWGILSETEAEAYPVIYLVEGGSPGHVSGIRRGSIVLALNDDDNVKVSLEKDQQGEL